MKSGNADCQVIDLLGELSATATLEVGGTGSAYTHAFPLTKDASYAFEYQFTSEGSVAAAVSLEQGNTLPTTEGTADAGFVVPEDAAAFDASVTDENVHIKAYAPAATAYARLKIVGAGGNDASTVLSKARVSVILGI